MAISTKGKRKITIHNRTYFWWVFDENDQTEFDGIQMAMVSEDQNLQFKYGMEQLPEKRYLKIAFGRNSGAVHLLCPPFENENGSMTPAGVRNMVEWVLDESNSEYSHSFTYAWKGKEIITDPVRMELYFKDIQNQIRND